MGRTIATVSMVMSLIAIAIWSLIGLETVDTYTLWSVTGVLSGLAIAVMFAHTSTTVMWHVASQATLFTWAIIVLYVHWDPSFKYHLLGIEVGVSAVLYAINLRKEMTRV